MSTESRDTRYRSEQEYRDCCILTIWPTASQQVQHRSTRRRRAMLQKGRCCILVELTAVLGLGQVLH